MNFSLRFRGLINMSDLTCSVISWDLSLSCAALFHPRCSSFTCSHPLKCSYQLEGFAAAPHMLLHFSHVVFCHASLVIKTAISAFHPGSVFSQCCSSACREVTPMMHLLDMLCFRIPLSCTCAAESASHCCLAVIEFGVSWVDRGDVWEGE